MTGARAYTTKIWRQPSSIGFSSADALSTSMDPLGEPVISTRKRPCQKIQNGSEFPELVAQNSRNPQKRTQRTKASIAEVADKIVGHKSRRSISRFKGRSPFKSLDLPSCWQ